MAAPVNANINVLVNTQQAMSQLRALQSQIAATNASISATSGSAAARQAALNKALMDGANASRMWSARMVPMNSAVQQFSTALDKGKMSLGQYTRYAASQLPGMSRVFRREFDMMSRVAETNVRRMQTQYVALGNSATAASQAMALTPTALNKQAAATAIAAQRQMMMNRMIDLGTTKLLNWGKNTQWAGRQLMVGFSIPLAMVGAVAAKAFKEIDKGSIAFKRVYGDLSTTTAEMERNLEAVKSLGEEYTKYGIKLADTIELSADVAATGAKNETLMAATEQTLRLATLGLMEYEEALQATIALQTAFGVSNEDLAETIDFLNVVENETILTMQDMAAAIPRVAPVIKGLGGDVKDLAVFMTAMREGGVTAEQGANALKSGLGRLINPTKAAREVMAGFGMSIDAIIQSNKGDLMGMIQDFGAALSTLGEFEQQQVLEKVFGKYQYARLGALFKNLSNDASQANRTIELTAMSMEDLASISERELGKIEEATSTKFTAAVERLKIAIAPVGEQFMKALMPVIDFVTKIANKFNDLPDNIKNAIAIGVAAIAGIGPIVLMTVGLIANGIANIGKLIQTMRKFFARLKGDASLFNYLTQEEQEAAAAARGLSGATDQLTGKFLGQQKALERLITLVGQYAKALGSTAAAAPLGMGVGSAAAMAKAAGAARTAGGTTVTGPRSGGTVVYGAGGLRMAKGGLVPGTGNKDTVPAMLTPGESVVTKQATQKYGPMIQAMNAGVKIPGFVNGITDLRGTYLTGAGKLINPVAMMQPGAGGNQSVAGVSRSQFPTATGQALFAGMGKSAMDLATRMQTLSRFSMSALKAFDPLDDLFNKIHGEVSSQLKNSATIDEAIQKAKPEVKRITSEYIKQKVTAGQMTKVEASRLRVATRLLMNEQSTVKRMGLVRAERLDVRGDRVIPRTQTEGKGAPLSTYRNLPRVAERELARRGLAVPRGFSQYERSHMQSVGKQPFISGMVSPRVQGKGLTPQAKQAIERIARQEAQTHTRAYEQATKDPALIARDRNSPHPIVTKDAQSDARQYANTVKQTLMGLTPIRTGKPLVAASTPNLPQGTQFRAPGGGVAQVYNPRNNPLGLGVTGEARAAKGAVAAIESRTGVLNRLRAEEEAQLAASKKFRVVDNRRTGATTKSAVLLEEENSFLTRGNQAAQRLAQQRALNEAALKAEQEAQARLNGAKQRAAVMQETMNQRPARGGMLDRPLGAIRRFAFPGGQDAALKNLGFNQFSGQVKTAGQLIMESAKNIKTRVAGTLRTLPADFKLATQQLLAEAKTAGSALKTDFKGLGGTIKTNMIVDLKTLTSPITATASAIRNLGTSATGAAQRMVGGIGNFMTSVDKNGTTRMQKMGQASNGAIMGLMGLSMAASFAGGGVGEMAQKIMPVTMGLMGLQMILPMLTNPIGLAIIATSALVAGFIYLRKQLDDTAKEAANVGANMSGVANAMQVIEDATGFQAPDLKDRLFRFTDEDRQAMSEFGSYFESEAGSKFVQELKEATSEERYTKVSRLIAQAIGSGLDEERARAFGFAIAEATGDAFLKSNIARDFANQVFRSGSQALIDLEKERISESPLTTARPDYSATTAIPFDKPGSPMEAAIRQGATVGLVATGGLAAYAAVMGGLAATGIGVPVAAIGTGAAAAFVAIASLAGGISGYVNAVNEQKAVTEEAAKAMGHALETTKNLANAEAVLEEERRSGAIEFEEYQRRKNEIDQMQSDLSEYFGQVFSMGADSGAMLQALGDQLTLAGFSEDQIKIITDKFNPDALAQLFYEKDFGELESAQKQYVQEVFQSTMSGLTPDNVTQRLADVEGTYKTIAEKVLDAAVNGVLDVESLFNEENLRSAISNMLGAKDIGMTYAVDTPGAGPRGETAIAGETVNPSDIIAARLQDLDMQLKEMGTDSIEVFLRLQEFLDRDLAISILNSEDDILRFGDAVTKLAGYEQISLEIVMKDKLDVDSLVEGIEKIKEFKFDKKSFEKNRKEIQRTAMSGEEFVRILTETGQAAGKTGEDINAAYGNALNQYDEMVDEVGKNKLGNIKITPKLIPLLFGEGVENATEIYNSLSAALPDDLPAMHAQILITALGNDAISQAILSNPKILEAIMAGKTTYDVPYYSAGKGGVAQQEIPDIVKPFANLISGLGDGQKLTPTGKKPPEKDGSGSSGAEKEQTALEKLQESIDKRTKLYLGVTNAGKKLDAAKKGYFGRLLAETTTNNSIANQLRKMNLSETLIADILAEGAESAQEIIDALGTSGLKRLSKTDVLSRAGELISEKRGEAKRGEYKETAKKRLEETGKFTAEEIENILQDEGATEIIALLPKKAARVWKQLINSLKKAEKATQEVQSATEQAADEFDLWSTKLDAYTTAIEQAFDAEEQAVRDRLSAEFLANTGMTTDQMQEQINANNRLIDQQQDLIDAKQEQINDYQRENDLIQQGIDDLKRQDEIRNRRSEILSKDLEKIAEAEENVREAYQKRIDALEKVADINNYLIEQQKKQLDLSRAISEGDIYAATAAAQEMRAGSAEQAVEQRRSALEQGMENAIAGLTNAEGMTRAQIEEEINNIKEQNYQNSLLIRIEEDKIYQNNLAVRDLTNQIYDINENMIEPLQNQNKEFERMLSYYAEDEEYAIRRVTVADMTREQFEKQADELRRSIDNAQELDPYLESLKGQYNAIWEAAKGAADEAERLARAQGEADRKAKEEAAASQNKYAGGLIKKYAAGGMVNPLKYTSNEPPPAQMSVGGTVFGNGSRDSVSAMLTPGEFVIRKAMVNKYGVPMMKALNQGSFAMPRYNTGQDFEPNVAAVNNTSVSNINAPVYNTYDMKFAINGSNQSADEIANQVMFKMRQLQSQGIRSNRGY